MPLPDRLQDLFEPELAREILARARRARAEPGEAILDFGRPVKTIPIVLSGLLKVTRVEEDGRELFLYHILPGESCAMTFTCCMQNHPSEIRAEAEDEVEYLAVPIEAMGEWLAKYPTWKDFVMRTIRGRFNELLKTLDLIAFRNLDQRLVAYLREKARASGSSLVNLTHERIAADLATARVVVSRLLKKLERDGKVLLYRNQIRLLGEL